jgi:acetylglutamate kinase
MTITVIKLGGSTLTDDTTLPQLAQALAVRAQPCIIVHGGGKAVSAMFQRVGIQPTFVDGQRVTDAATVGTVEMVLSGQVNKHITRELVQAGVDAMGLSGVDRGLLRVEPWSAQMSRVGRITAVRADVLRDLCGRGIVPIISPIALGPEGSYNVNADHVAGAIAGALSSEDAVFLTDVPGIQVDGAVRARLTQADIDSLIAAGVIHGGMIPKVRASLNALAQGAKAARITNITGLAHGTGTTLTL